MTRADWRPQNYVVMQFAEVNIVRASGKEEAARTLKVSVSTLKDQNNELEKQVYLKSEMFKYKFQICTSYLFVCYC
jgi:hypothetical protein